MTMKTPCTAFLVLFAAAVAAGAGASLLSESFSLFDTRTLTVKPSSGIAFSSFKPVATIFIIR